ncbi:hypothetical protein Tco_0177495 [Tanacetum coccineum]
MTGNKGKLADFVKIKGGIVTFGGGDGKITGKGTIRTSNFNFENVYYLGEYLDLRGGLLFEMIHDVCIAWSVCGFILMRTIPSGWICVISGVARVSTSGNTGFYWLNNFYWFKHYEVNPLAGTGMIL